LSIFSRALNGAVSGSIQVGASYTITVPKLNPFKFLREVMKKKLNFCKKKLRLKIKKENSI
jgi:hypothetical protein